MPELVVMVGLSGSGKTTMANLLVEDYNVNDKSGKECKYVSSDDIRVELTGDILDQSRNGEVFEIFHRRIREATENLHNVVVDATNLTMKSRRAIFSNIKNRDKYLVQADVMATDINVCYNQNAKREHPIPKDVIFRQVHHFEIPFYEEGFDDIYLENIPHAQEYYGAIAEGVNDKNSDWAIPEYLIKPMRGFDQRNHHHLFDLYTHSLCVANHIVNLEEGKVWLCGDKAPNYRFIKAAMLHDYGKLFTAEPKKDLSGEYSYHNHANVGTYKLLQSIRDLRFASTDECLEFLFYVNYHMRPFNWIKEGTTAKYKAIFGETKYRNLMVLNQYDEISSVSKGAVSDNRRFTFFKYGYEEL